MAEITVRAYAKINLSLDVLGKMDDGYHAISTVFQQIGIFDTVVVRTEADAAARRWDMAPEIFLAVAGDEDCLRGVPTDDGNIAVKATRLFFSAMGERAEESTHAFGEIHIAIEKRVPSGAGLAGGSADAAAVLLGLAACFDMKDGYWSEWIMEQAALLGADVPFCVMGQAYLNPELGFSAFRRAAPCALGEGRGNILRTAPPLSGWVLLVKPPVFSSTAHVYNCLNVEEITMRPDTGELLVGLAEGDFARITKNMVNVLEPPALMEYPEIMDVKLALEECGGALRVMMTGSGSAVFAFFRYGRDCHDAASRLGGLPNGSRVFVAPLMI